jgi:hypothetical protein
MRYLILAQSDVTARALGAWLELLGEPPLEEEPGGCMMDGRILSHRGADSFPGGFVCGFQTISAKLGAMVEEPSPGGTLVLVDTVNLEDLSAVGSPSGWNRLLALLILAFPEVRWVFGVFTGSENEENQKLQLRHGLVSLFGPVFDPLYDGTGLRNHIRGQTRHTKNGEKPVAPWIPVRRQWAVAIDDEAAYAHLHTYIAYRHGYRGFAITTKALADQVLGTSKNVENGKAEEFDLWDLSKPDLTLEDLFLGFPDKQGGDHWANLETRGNAWWKLSTVADNNFELRRYIISSRHDHGLGNSDRAINRGVMSQLRAKNRSGLEVLKPVSGIFALWKALRLDRELKSVDKSTGRHYRGLAPKFFWPPEPDRDRPHYQDGEGEAKSGETSGGHSAPGLLLLVAETLIERAERIIDNVRNVKDAVRGAVLATSALELLGPRTPTTARDALELKHRFEVLAECQFGGIEYNLQLEERFDEIRTETRLLGAWYGRRAREVAVLNAELAILSRLVTIFRDYNEFDEEDKTLQRVRSVQRGIWLRRAGPAAWLVWPFRAYVEYLLGSTVRFATALFLWVTGLTLIFWVGGTDENLAHALHAGVTTFFGFEPPGADEAEGVAFTAGLLGAFSGFLHLGIFISRLYNLISRK